MYCVCDIYGSPRPSCPSVQPSFGPPHLAGADSASFVHHLLNAYAYPPHGHHVNLPLNRRVVLPVDEAVGVGEKVKSTEPHEGKVRRGRYQLETELRVPAYAQIDSFALIVFPAVRESRGQSGAKASPSLQ